MEELANSSSFCDTGDLEKEKSPFGLGVGASGMNSWRNRFTGMGPTNFSHVSKVMSAYRSKAFLGGVEVWVSQPEMSRFRGVVSASNVLEATS
jgi:hypothetical protein